MYRIGFATDIHRLVKERKLILGGVLIPYELGLLGHSDADVIYHAVAESMLGALALGDLGKYFPNDDKCKNMDSSLIVKTVFKMIDEQSYLVNNIDISIVAEEPKLAPYILEMRKNIASLLNIDISLVSVKAGTNEGVDEVGRKEAISASAIVLLRKKD